MEASFKKIWKKSGILGEINMIFVTIGTMYGFQRLIKEMDEIAKDIEEDVIMQIGETIYEPKNTRYFRFSSREEMNKIYKDARIIICHAGVGSIISALDYMKPVIVIPRKKEFGEVIDDHQIEITRELESEGIINAIYDINELRNILKEKVNFHNTINNNKKENLLARKLKEYLNELSYKI